MLAPLKTEVLTLWDVLFSPELPRSLGLLAPEEDAGTLFSVPLRKAGGGSLDEANDGGVYLGLGTL